MSARFTSYPSSNVASPVDSQPVAQPKSISNSSTPPAGVLGMPAALPTAAGGTVASLQAVLDASERKATAYATERDAALGALGHTREQYLQADTKLREVATSLAAVLHEHTELHKELAETKKAMQLRAEKHSAAMAKVNDRVNVAARIDTAIVRLYLLIRYQSSTVCKLPPISDEELAEVRRAQPLSTLHLCQEWMGRFAADAIAKKDVEDFLLQFLKARNYCVRSPLPPTLALTNILNGVATANGGSEGTVGSKTMGLIKKPAALPATKGLPGGKISTMPSPRGGPLSVRSKDTDGGDEQEEIPFTSIPPLPAELPPWVIAFVANTDVLEGKGDEAAEAEAREKARAANATRTKFQQIAQLAQQQAAAQVAAMAEDPMRHIRAFDGFASRHVKDFPEAIAIIDKQNDKLDQLVRVVKELEERHRREVSAFLQKEEEVRGTSTQGALRSLREQLRAKNKELEECHAEIKRYRVYASDYVVMQREVNEANEKALHSKVVLEQREAELLRTQRNAIERSLAAKDTMKTLAAKADAAAKLENENVKLNREVRDLSSQLRRMDLPGLREGKERAEAIAAQEGIRLRAAESALLTAEARAKALTDTNARMAAEYNAIFKAHIAAMQRQREAEAHEAELESKQFVMGDRSPLMAEHYLGKYQDAMQELNRAQRKLRHLLMVAHHDQSSSAKRIANLEEDLVKEKGARWAAEVSMQQQTDILVLSQSQIQPINALSDTQSITTASIGDTLAPRKKKVRKSTLSRQARALMAGTHALSPKRGGTMSGNESAETNESTERHHGIGSSSAQRLVGAVSNITVSAEKRTVTLDGGSSPSAKVTLDSPTKAEGAQEGLPPPSSHASPMTGDNSVPLRDIGAPTSVAKAMAANWITQGSNAARPSTTTRDGTGAEGPEVSNRIIPKGAVVGTHSFMMMGTQQPKPKAATKSQLSSLSSKQRPSTAKR